VKSDVRERPWAERGDIVHQGGRIFKKKPTGALKNPVPQKKRGGRQTEKPKPRKQTWRKSNALKEKFERGEGGAMRGFLQKRTFERAHSDGHQATKRVA